MNSFSRQMLAIALSGALLGLPMSAASPRSLVGVAQGAGSIQINGRPFSGHASLFSGDKVVTGNAAPLTVVSSSAERFRFGSNTSGQVTRQQKETMIRLDSGAVEFQTAGATFAQLPGDVAVRPTAHEVTVALVHRLANGTAEVAVYKGSVEVAAASEKATVSAGHTAMLRPVSSAQAQNNNQQNRKKKAWAIFITTGLSAGAVAGILLNEQSHPVSVVDP